MSEPFFPKTGGPAFPCVAPNPELIQYLGKHRDEHSLSLQEVKSLAERHGGITIRDYFAGQAMQAILTNQKFFELVLKTTGGAQVAANEAVASNAYAMADAMIAERQ